jgi:hypothetical protein
MMISRAGDAFTTLTLAWVVLDIAGPVRGRRPVRYCGDQWATVLGRCVILAIARSYLLGSLPLLAPALRGLDAAAGSRVQIRPTTG